MPSIAAKHEHQITARSPKVRRRWGEQSFAVVAMLVFAGAGWPLLAGANSPESLLLPSKSVPELRLVTYPIYTVVIGLTISHAKRIVPLFRENWILLFLVALAFVSSAWSADPALTFRRSAVLAVTTAFALYLVSRFAPAEIMKLVVLSFGIAGMSSLLFVLVDPSLAIEVDERGAALRGVFVQKNVFGEFMLFGGAAALILAASRTHRAGIYYLLVYFLAMALTVLSNSVTYIVIGFLLIPVVVIAVIKRRVSRLHFGMTGIVAFAIILLLSVTLASDPDTVLGLLARDRTLTGRTEVWQAVWEYIQMRFWLGYGYGAFWDGWMAPGHDIRMLIGAYPHAHNGWLDLWLSLGAIGVAFMAASFLGALCRTIRNFGRGDEVTTLISVVFLIAILLLTPVENGLLIQNSSTWVLYAIASASANSAARHHRNQRASKPLGQSKPVKSLASAPPTKKRL
ncbi:MAG: O-antigen ligase family protein [Aestuariivirga sp.]